MTMREKQLRIMKRVLLSFLTIVNAIIIPILVRNSIEATLADTGDVFNNYLARVNFTIIFIILLGLICLIFVLLGLFLDEFSLLKLLLSIFNALVSAFSILLWSALLVIEILVEDNYISLDISGAFLVLIILPALYLLRNCITFKIKRNVLWYYITILNSVSNNIVQDFHQLKKNVSDSILKEKKTYFLKNFDALMASLFESEQPLIKRQDTAFILTDIGAELLYKYQTIL
jgi:hypothetical protein